MTNGGTGRICEGRSRRCNLTKQFGIVRIGKGRGINGLLQTDQTFEGSRPRLGEQGFAQCCVQVCFSRPTVSRKRVSRKRVSTKRNSVNKNIFQQLLQHSVAQRSKHTCPLLVPLPHRHHHLGDAFLFPQRHVVLFHVRVHHCRIQPLNLFKRHR